MKMHMCRGLGTALSTCPPWRWYTSFKYANGNHPDLQAVAQVHGLCVMQAVRTRVSAYGAPGQGRRCMCSLVMLVYPLQYSGILDGCLLYQLAML